MANALLNTWRGLWREPPPGLACEFAAGGLSVARWSPGSAKVERMAVRDLPTDVLRPQPVRENLAEPEVVSAALHSALEDAQSVQPGKKRREIAVLLPDQSARVTMLSFDEVPQKQEEIASLIKFRLKKTVPFDIESATISWNLQGRDVLVAVTPRAIVRQYEVLFEQLGYLPGQVTVSSLAGINLLVDSGEPGAGSMLLRRNGPTVTIALSSKNRMRMMRTTEQADTGAGAELFHDIFSSAVFYQDTYGAPVDRIFHTGFDEVSEPLWAQIEAELNVCPRPLVIPGTPPASEACYLGIFGMLAEQAKA